MRVSVFIVSIKSCSSLFSEPTLTPANCVSFLKQAGLTLPCACAGLVSEERIAVASAVNASLLNTDRIINLNKEFKDYSITKK